MLLKADKGAVQYVDESKTDWAFTVMSKDHEIGLIIAYDTNTGEPIDLGHRLEKCIFVSPGEYADLIEELEALRDYGGMEEMADEDPWKEGYQEAMNAAIKLVAQRANPPTTAQ